MDANVISLISCLVKIVVLRNALYAVCVGLYSKFEHSLIGVRCTLHCRKEVNKVSNCKETTGQQLEYAHADVAKIESIHA